MFLLASLGTPSVLQAYSSFKAITFGIPCTYKSNVTYNYTNIILVQDQAFMD